MVGLVVYGAHIQDRGGAPLALASIRHRWPWLRHVFADGGYSGPKLRKALKGRGGWKVEIVKRSDAVKASKFCPVAGSSSAPSHGWIVAEEWRETGRRRSPHPKHGPTSPISECSPDASQGIVMFEGVSSQALRFGCLLAIPWKQRS